MSWIINLIAVCALISLVLQIKQTFVTSKPVNNDEKIANAVLTIERQIEVSTEYQHILACEKLIEVLLLEKFEMGICHDHVQDLMNKIQAKRMWIQVTKSEGIEENY